MIRVVTVRDAEAILGIYAPIVRDTAISFEWEVPAVAEIRSRIERVQSAGFPWLVAVPEGGGVDSRVVAHAYASSFRARTAYSWTAEVSIHVEGSQQRRGIGRQLYSSLLRVLELQGYRSAIGVATSPNASSEALHRSLGFEQAGRIARVGFKFGAWHDVIIWRKGLGALNDQPADIRPVGEVLDELGMT